MSPDAWSCRFHALPPYSKSKRREPGRSRATKVLTKDDIRELTQAQKLELLEMISESLEQDEVPVSPEVRMEVEFRLKTYEEDKKTALS